MRISQYVAIEHYNFDVIFFMGKIIVSVPYGFIRNI